MKNFFSLLLLTILGTQISAFAKTPGEVPVGALLPEARMQGLGGPSRQLSDFRGKPLIVNLWASWCGPCREEMGSLEKLARRDAGKQFQVIGISTDDYSDAAKSYLQKAGVSFSQFIDGHQFMENMLGADRIPLTVLIDAQGKVLGKYYGAKDWDSPQAHALIEKSFRLKIKP